MVMRVGGLASGMDIDELVKKLMTAERIPLDKLNQKKTIYEWQRDAYRGVNTKIKTFDTYIADNFILKNINSKTATSSNSDLVSAIATSKASPSLTIEGVSQLATAARAVGQQVSADGSTKMIDLIGSPSTIELKSIQSNGQIAAEPTKIDITADMTVDDFISKVNSSNAGVNAIFEGGRFSFTAKNTGDIKNGEEIQIVSGKSVFEKLGFFKDEAGNPRDKFQSTDGKNAIFQVNGIATERTTNSFTISGYNVTLKDTFNTDRTDAERYNAAYKDWKNTTSQDFLDKIKAAEEAKALAEQAYIAAQEVFAKAKENAFGAAEPTAEDRKTFNIIGNAQFVRNLDSDDLVAIRGNTFDSKESYAKWLNDDTNTDNQDVKAKLKAANISYDQYKAVQSLDDDKLKSLSSEAIYNSIGTSFLSGLTDDEKDILNKFEFPMTEDKLNERIAALKQETSTDAEKALGEKLDNLSTSQKAGLRELSSKDELNNMVALAEAATSQNEALVKKNAADKDHKALIDREKKAKEDFESAYEKQNGSLAGIENAKEITVPPGSVTGVTMTSTTDVDDMMKNIKDFVATYNGFIKDLSGQTKESKYRDYTPLTAEQKKDMSENEIKLWEEKAKSGLLRGDSLIRNGLSDMRSLVYQANPAVENSEFNSLFKIGITSSKNYNEGGTLEIDEVKLRKALEEDPDSVAKLFSFSDGKEKDTIQVEENGVMVSKEVDTRGFFQKVRGSMKEMEINIEKKAGRSTMTDNQYSIGQSLIDAEKRIDTWEFKLKNIEARYWKQFAAMETAINKANSQSSLFMQQG